MPQTVPRCQAYAQSTLVAGHPPFNKTKTFPGSRGDPKDANPGERRSQRAVANRRIAATFRLARFCDFQGVGGGKVAQSEWDQKRAPPQPRLRSDLKLVRRLLSPRELTSLLSITCMLAGLLDAASGIKCFPADNAGVTSEERAHSVSAGGGSQFGNHNWSFSFPFPPPDFSFSSAASPTL